MTQTALMRPANPLAKFLTLLLCATVASAATAQISEAAAESLMKKSGLWRQVESVGAQIGQGMSQALEEGDIKLPPAVKEQMVAASVRSMSAERLRRDIRSELMVSIRAADLPALDKWLDGAIGKRMTAIEEGISNVDAGQLIAEGQQIWSKADPARRKALERFIQSARLVELMTDMSINVASAVAYGAMSAVPGPSAQSFPDVRGMVSAQRETMSQSMLPVIQAMSAAAYAKVSNADLIAYANFMTGAAGSRYMTATSAAFDKAIVRAAVDFGQAIVDSMSTVKS